MRLRSRRHVTAGPPPRDDAVLTQTGVDPSLVREAEAEAAAAEVQAAAAHARARALRARMSDSASNEDLGDRIEPTTTDTADSDGDLTKTSEPGARRKQRRRRPSLATAVVTLAVITGVALSAASGQMWWHHQQVVHDQHIRAEFAAAATQAVVTLMSIDSAKAEDNVAQIIANATGQFLDDFQSAADDFVRAAHDSKSVTKATAQACAVESMTPHSAVVLVTAATTVSNSAGADQRPRNWRLSVDMVREGQQIKLSKVEFVP